MGKERKLLAQDFVLWKTGESLAIVCSSQLLTSTAGCSDPHSGPGSMALRYVHHWHKPVLWFEHIKILTIELLIS